MKSIVCRIAALAVELAAALAACLGCSSKQPPENTEPAQPSQIHWHGPATGYEGKVEKPTDPA